jgi:hypothetical protein
MNPVTRQDGDPPRTTATIVGVITAATYARHDHGQGYRSAPHNMDN